MSRWAYRRLGSTPTGYQHPVTVANDVAILSGKQLAEYMLCRGCEERIARREQYVSTITADTAGNFPALTYTRTVYEHDAEWQVADASELDCDALAYFVASVIWRASVSARLPRVTLGSYEAAFADFLLHRTPFPQGVALIIELMRPTSGPGVDLVITEPESERTGLCHLHSFAVFGMLFRLIVGRVHPDGVKSFCFVGKKLVVLSHGRHLLDALVAKAKTATSKGSLARRPR